jgi:hypothetical protein
MAEDNPANCRISSAHLALLERWANSDPDRKIVNLIIARMLQERVNKLWFIGDGSETRVQVRQHETDGIEEWTATSVNLKRIWRRLTFMSSPPLPWWNQLPFWYSLSFHITERINRWFWHPSLRNEGRMEFVALNKPFTVTFRHTGNNRIELTYCADPAAFPETSNV